MKQVIFIGGSSYSGSTFLNLILANAPDAFSCGEVSMYFRPNLVKYYYADCSCGDPNCQVWPKLREGGEAKLYEHIFERFPHVNVIVDSSKSPNWIKDMSEHLDKSGIAYKNILIWKTPEEFKSSRIKRHREHGWRRAWVNFHRTYFRLIKNWVAVEYSELANRPDLLKPLCECLDLPFHDGQENYWNKTHHSLFGNSSANIHLHKENSSAFNYYKNEIKDSWSDYDIANSEHQKIRYSEKVSEVKAQQDETTRDPMIERILNVLKARDFRNTDAQSWTEELRSEVEALKCRAFWPYLQRAKYRAWMLKASFQKQFG